jgi:dCMP deaminase
VRVSIEKLAHFMEIAKSVSKLSKDRSRKVGALIIGPDWGIRSTGYNGFPRKVNDDVEERHLRPTKYFFSEHAERNAIYAAAKVGTSTDGCSIFVTTLFVCQECARAIIQSGIIKVVVEVSPDFNDATYGESFKMTLEMFNEAEVEVLFLDVLLKSSLPSI